MSNIEILTSNFEPEIGEVDDLCDFMFNSRRHGFLISNFQMWRNDKARLNAGMDGRDGTWPQPQKNNREFLVSKRVLVRRFFCREVRHSQLHTSQYCDSRQALALVA